MSLPDQSAPPARSSARSSAPSVERAVPRALFRWLGRVLNTASSGALLLLIWFAARARPMAVEELHFWLYLLLLFAIVSATVDSYQARSRARNADALPPAS